MTGDHGQLYTDAEHLAERSASDEAIEATLEGCGLGPFKSALELGGAIGEFTERLAPRCERLTRIDVSATAAAMARRRLVDFPRVEVVRGAIPDAIPDRDYDLVVASEILYFLSADDFERTLATIRARLVPNGRFVAVHWRTEESDRVFAAGNLHARLRDDPWLQSVRGEQAPGYLLDVLERR
jgi:cyclopropane fatty-acyl-phospholipid synthase-like methyltransferase